MRDSLHSLNRRDFLAQAACAAGGLSLSGCLGPRFTPASEMYSDKVGDRLWIWGHHAEALRDWKNGGYRAKGGLPARRHIDVYEACRYLGIRNAALIPWGGGFPADPFDPYYRRYRDMRRTAWRISMGGPECLIPFTEVAFEFQEQMGNLTTCYLDDYFVDKDYIRPLDELREVRDRLHSRDIKLTVVLYTDQGGGINPTIRPSVDICDEVSLWFWNGKNLGTMEEQVHKCRAFIGEGKSMLLGIYMWDWGAGKPIPPETMRRQLDLARKFLAEGTVSGLIFHSNLNCDIGDPSAEISRLWIAEHADESV